MPEVTRLTATAAENAGFEVVTSAAANEYHTVVRYTDQDDDVVDVTDRWKIDAVTGERQEAEQKVTDTVEDVLEDLGVSVK